MSDNHMMPTDYMVPSQNICIEQEIKRSRFIVNIARAKHKEDAVSFIKQVSAQYPDARHNCWAYIAGHPIESIERASFDAGEPSGTAGKPMLNVLQHKALNDGIGEICVVISRYFGGIKLGAGGLVRAYSSSIQLAMDILPLKKIIITIAAEACFPYELENQIRHLLTKHHIEICGLSYAEQTKIIFLVPITMKNTLRNIISDKTHGKVHISYPMHK